MTLWVDDSRWLCILLAPASNMTYDTTCVVPPSGLYVLGNPTFGSVQRTPTYLPQLSLQAKASILSSLARTTFTQTFSNPLADNIPQLRYTFPLFDGVSVVSFTCTINGDRVIKGVVQERQKARQTFKNATARGETAGLLEQQPSASDVFTTTIGNVPGGAKIKVDIVVLGELKHDAETDGIRFTIPTHIAPRYGSYPSTVTGPSGTTVHTRDISIVVDVELPTGSTISSLQSPSHPIAISIGTLSTSRGSTSPSPHLASASLSLGKASLDQDFTLQIVAANTDNPVAILETHPTIPNQRAVMATLVPRFNLPMQRPEIVFLCDRSGSMGGTKIANLSSALQLFLKSLPLGVTFNICGFGSHYEFLFPESRLYDHQSLETAMKYAERIAANFGGTEIEHALVHALDRGDPDRDLEIFLLTDGQVWTQTRLFDMVNHRVEKSKGAIRVFTLGIGSDASHSLVQGLARAGKGFSQSVSDNERMEKKVIRMLKGALTPHITDYTLEVKYRKPDQEFSDYDECDLTYRVADLALDLDVSPADMTTEPGPQVSSNPISLFDPNFDPDAQIESAGILTSTERLASLPSIPIPKVLQTPSEIPPLYPFNRTSVYLIMSSDTGEKTPESIILRATSKHGPLKLEIPVTMTTTGETVHQLAARKAIHELEEGRGWIFQAKQRASNVPLQGLYKNQFSAMVEREAVRLGVQFQVGGKWCSFVAVEDNDVNDAESWTTIIAAEAQQESQYQNPYLAMQTAVRHRQSSAGFGQANVAPGAQLFGASTASIAPHDSLIRRPVSLASQSSTSSLFGNLGSNTTHSSTTGGGFGAKSSLATTPLTGDSLFGAPQSFSTLDSSAAGGLFGSQPHAMPASGYPPVGAPKKRKVAFASMSPSSSLASIHLPPAPTPDEGPLSLIVRQQHFSGCWFTNIELFNAIDVTQERFAELLTTTRATTQQLINPQNANTDLGTMAVTIAVVVFLRTRLVSEKDAWELLADKALFWLESCFYGTRENVEEAIAELEKIMG